MNMCRTCKYWGRSKDGIGVGVCTNIDAHSKVFISDGRFLTTQNFGCVEHQEGEPINNIHTKEDNFQALCDFYDSQR